MRVRKRLIGMLSSLGICPRISPPISTGISVIASRAAPVMAEVLVKASGANSHPSLPCREQIGMNEKMMISRLRNSAGPNSAAASVMTR